MRKKVLRLLRKEGEWDRIDIYMILRMFPGNSHSSYFTAALQRLIGLYIRRKLEYT